MTPPGLTELEVGLLGRVFGAHPEVRAVRLFGSRAKGTHKPWSDVDLALSGELNELGAAAIAAELDELPLPYLFDVVVFEQVRLPALHEHIERVGWLIYKGTGPFAPTGT